MVRDYDILVDRFDASRGVLLDLFASSGAVSIFGVVGSGIWMVM